MAPALRTAQPSPAAAPLASMPLASMPLASMPLAQVPMAQMPLTQVPALKAWQAGQAVMAHLPSPQPQRLPVQPHCQTPPAAHHEPPDLRQPPARPLRRAQQPMAGWQTPWLPTLRGPVRC